MRRTNKAIHPSRRSAANLNHRFLRRLGDRRRYPTETPPFVSSLASTARDHSVHHWATRVVPFHLRAVCDPTRSNAVAGDTCFVCSLGRVRIVVSLAERLCVDHRMFGGFTFAAQYCDDRRGFCIPRKKSGTKPVLPNRFRFDEHRVCLRANAFCRPCGSRYTWSCPSAIGRIAGGRQ